MGIKLAKSGGLWRVRKQGTGLWFEPVPHGEPPAPETPHKSPKNVDSVQESQEKERTPKKLWNSAITASDAHVRARQRCGCHRRLHVAQGEGSAPPYRPCKVYLALVEAEDSARKAAM